MRMKVMVMVMVMMMMMIHYGNDEGMDGEKVDGEHQAESDESEDSTERMGPRHDEQMIIAHDVMFPFLLWRRTSWYSFLPDPNIPFV